MVKALSEMVQATRVRAHVSPDAVITSVINWQEVKDLIDASVDVIVNNLRAQMERSKQSDLPETSNTPSSETTDPETEDVVQNFRRFLSQITQQMFGSEEAIRLLCLREFHVYLLPLGWLYTASSPIMYDDLLPNILGGDPFPTTAQLALRKYDPSSRTAIVEWHQSVDTATLWNSVLQFAGNMQEALRALVGEPPDLSQIEGDAIPNLSLEDSAEYVIDIEAGWVQSMRWQRTARVEDTTRVDTFAISVKTSPD